MQFGPEVLLLLVGCGGDVAPDWLAGVDVTDLDTSSKGRNFMVRGVPYPKLAERLESAGWRSWRASFDEGADPAFQARWSRGGTWVDVGALSARNPDHWTLRRVDTPPPRAVAETPARLGMPLVRGRSDALADATGCSTSEGLTLTLRLDGGFSMGGPLDGSPAQVEGRWSLAGAGLVFQGEVQRGARKRAWESTCDDLLVLGSDHRAEVVHCTNGKTWFCGVDAGPVVLVRDAGAGTAAADHVTRALRRDDRPAEPGKHLEGVETKSQVFRAGEAAPRADGVWVRYREDRAQAERYAYRLNRDLELYGAFVEERPDAPAPFVVEVGGQVRDDGAPPPPSPPPIPEIEVNVGVRPPAGPAVFALVPDAEQCSWTVASPGGEPVEIAHSERCPEGLVLGEEKLVARFADITITRRWPGVAWSEELAPAGEDAVLDALVQADGVVFDLELPHACPDCVAPLAVSEVTDAPTRDRLSGGLGLDEVERVGWVELSRGVLIAPLEESEDGELHPVAPVSWCRRLTACGSGQPWEVPEGPLSVFEAKRFVLVGREGTGGGARVYRTPASAVLAVPDSVRAVWVPDGGLPGFRR